MYVCVGGGGVNLNPEWRKIMKVSLLSHVCADYLLQLRDGNIPTNDEADHKLHGQFEKSEPRKEISRFKDDWNEPSRVNLSCRRSYLRRVAAAR